MVTGRGQRQAPSSTAPQSNSRNQASWQTRQSSGLNPSQSSRGRNVRLQEAGVENGLMFLSCFWNLLCFFLMFIMFFLLFLSYFYYHICFPSLAIRTCFH